MLVLVCGPTGIGKTTLMRRLARRHGCGVVTTWTTRPARPSDPFKISLDAAAYERAAGRFFWPAQRLYGHLYGEDYAALMAAACPRVERPWLLDMALDTLWLYDALPRRILLMLPADAGFLAATLAAAGRPDRLARATEEEAAWRTALAGGRLPGAAVIACRLGAEAAVADSAAAVVADWRAAAAAATAVAPAGSPAYGQDRGAAG